MRITKDTVSTAIKQVSYDTDTKILTIVFNRGAAYDYHDVPYAEFKQMVEAKSTGQYYNQHIKSFYM